MSTWQHNIPPHPIRSLLPALDAMEALGFDRQTLLQGTGILLSQLEDPEVRITLQQELAFYGKVMKSCNDPTIGLKLGEHFFPQRYGLFGYALMSAATFRHALTLIDSFGRLTFTFFTLRPGVSGKHAWLSMSDSPLVDEALIALYLDRDMSACVLAFQEILGTSFLPEQICLSHDGHGRQASYREYFGCDIEFSADCGKVVFASDLLDKPLPHSDPDSAHHLYQQCQLLIAKLTSQGLFIDDVRRLILSRPGFFPDIDYVAEQLGLSSRTLRRRLTAEGSSYRQLLDEVRYGLAREYLETTCLPMEEISNLLGFTEPGNFSQAFKRWSGLPPSEWRQASASPCDQQGR